MSHFEPVPYRITAIKGNMITALSNGRSVTRNVSFFKKWEGGELEPEEPASKQFVKDREHVQALKMPVYGVAIFGNAKGQPSELDLNLENTDEVSIVIPDHSDDDESVKSLGITHIYEDALVDLGK
jgi:hypothetical protein